MTAQKGAAFLLKIGDGNLPATYFTVAGLRTTQMSINGDAVVITSKDSGGWRELLSGAGTRSVSDPEVRAECAAETQFLRGLLAVGRAPDPMRRPARIWLLLLRVSSCQVSVRGSFAQAVPPPGTVGQIGGCIDTICALAPGCSVTLSAFEETTAGSLTLIASGPSVLLAGEPLADRVAALAPTAWRDVSDDTLTVEWTWPKAADARAAAG